MSNSSIQSLGLSLGTSGVTAGTYGNGSSLTQLTVNANGQITAASTQPITSINGGPISGYRNVIINGGMQVSQRGSSGSFNSLGALVYPSIDRWNGYQGGAGPFGTVAQSTVAPAGFQFSMKTGRPSGLTNTNYMNLSQIVETVNTIPLQGQTVTLSFYAKCGTTFSAPGTTFQTIIATGTGTDEGAVSGLSSTWTGYNSLANVADTLTTSFQRFTHTVTIPSNATELMVAHYWNGSGTAGADDNVYLTGVQLEVGSTATVYENKSYAQELSLCQRYYEKSFIPTTTPANNAGVNTGEFQILAGTAGAGTNVGFITFSETKRTTPTVTLFNPANTNGSARDETLGADCSTTLNTALNQDGFLVTIAGNASTTFGNRLGIHWTAAAEL